MTEIDQSAASLQIWMSPSLPLSQIVARCGVRYDFDKSKDEWALPELTSDKTLALGASNVRRIPIKALPPSWVACSYSGATIHDFINIIKAYKGEKPSKVVLNCGLNDRNNNEQRIKQDLGRLITTCDEVFGNGRTSFVINNVSKFLSSDQKKRIHLINNVLKDRPKTIPPIDQNLFVVNEQERLKIHWTTETAEHIKRHWVSCLNAIQ